MVFDVTADVLTVKVAEVLPAGMVIVVGTVAEDPVAERAMASPPVGAPILIVTVPMLVLPPTTDVGLSVTDLTVGGVSVTVVVPEMLFNLAVKVTEVSVETAIVFTVKVADIWPDATVAVAGTVAAD